MEAAEAVDKHSDEEHSRLGRRLQRTIGIITITTALFVLFGWVFDIGWLKGLKSNWATMNVTTAICFLATGISVLLADGTLLSRRKPFKISIKNGETWSFLLAFIPSLLGIQSIVEDVSDGALGFDFGMGLNTGICSFFLGSAIIVLSSRGPKAPLVSQLLAAIAAMIAFFAIIGYLFDVDELYRIAGYTSMGLHTAVLKLLLCIAIFALESKMGPMRLLSSSTVGGYMARRLGLAILVTNLFLGWVYVKAENNGFVSPDLAVMLLVFSNTLVSLIWINKIAGQLNIIDEERRSTERLVKEIINSAPAIIYVRGLDGRIKIANAEFDKQVLAKRSQSMRDTEGAPEKTGLDACDIKVIRTGQKVTQEESFIFEGEPRTFVTNRFPVYDQHDRLIGIGGVWTDITTRKNFEEKLRQNEEGLRTLANAIPSIVWAAEPDGSMEYFNQRWTEYTGIPVKDTNFTSWLKVIHPQDLEGIRRAWARALKEGTPFSIEARIWGREGAYRWHLLRSLPLKSPTGEILEWFGSMTDIEDQKRQAEILEKRVEGRTQELMSANRELEAFSYSVSHDLRAPLRSMDGFSQILLDRYGSKLDEAGKGYLRRVRSASQSMANLIDDLLTLSRISRTEIVREPVDLSQMATEIIDDKRRAEPERKVSVVVERGLMAVADASLLRIALWNLIDNAWKYTSKASDAVIGFKGSKSADGRMVYTVQDNGVGFDMAHADQLFKAFQRLHSAHEFPGTGIGLATAHRIIERHGGKIWAESRPGAGSAFHFNLGEAERKS